MNCFTFLARGAIFNPRTQVALETNTERATWEQALVQITPDDYIRIQLVSEESGEENLGVLLG
jgi:hypothetical protein